MVIVSDRELRTNLYRSMRASSGPVVKGVFASDTSIFSSPRDYGLGSTGIGVGALLPDREVRNFLIDPFPKEDQFQGASLDLRVGNEVFVMKGNFTSLDIADIERHAISRHELSYGMEFILTPGKVYVVKSLERMRIPPEYQGISDAKSSLARIGCGAGAATIRDGIIGGDRYYSEPEHIYFKMRPHAFPVIIRAGESSPIQIRFREIRSGPLTLQEIRDRYGRMIRLSENGADLDPGRPHLFEENGLVLTLDTTEHYVQKDAKTPIDITKFGYYDPEEFFTFVRDGEGVEVMPGRLYLFGSNETIHLDNLMCGDLVRSPDTLGQALSNNFARFIQPGFNGEITMEVWNYDPFGSPWFLRNRQYFGRVLVEALDGYPRHVYQENGSYVNQKAPRLPKFFKT